MILRSRAVRRLAGRSLVVFFLLVTAACAAAPSSVTGVPLGTEFTLKPGEAALVQSTDLLVTFLGVVDDSRCPADAICVQAGDAVVALRVGTALIQLRSASAPESVVGIYRVRVARVEPYPFASKPVAAADYRVTIVVTGR